MSNLTFKGWRPFHAVKRQEVINRWLSRVAQSAEKRFRRGMLGAHSGRVYRRKDGGIHQASAPHEYPANDTGGLIASAKSRSNQNEATFGTNVHYAKYLREGTGRMARRKMSDDAIVEAAAREKRASRGWAGFGRNKRFR